MSQPTQRIVAGGDILPFRFIKPDTTEDHQGLQASANAQIIGVAGQETKFAPLEDLVTTNNHAEDGDTVNLHGPGGEALVEAGASFDAGTRLKADSVGRAVPIATSGTAVQEYGGRSQQSAAAAGELIRINVEPGSIRPALS